MTDMITYQLKDFSNITFDGFNFNLPEETMQIISKLSLEVGSPSYIKTPVVRKRENLSNISPLSLSSNGINSSNNDYSRSNICHWKYEIIA